MKGDLPSRDELLELFDCDLDAGSLMWKPRAKSAFPHERAWKSWNCANAGKPALTSLAKVGYLRGSIHGRQYYAHRVLWKIATGAEAELIDHINQIKTDNRIANLRSTNKRVNALNKYQNENIGVRQNRAGNYFAMLGYEYLGTFATIELAQAARRLAWDNALKECRP